jgi:bifunctional ADP-heptose synthase (sugar kinase/adenylyltransferase)
MGTLQASQTGGTLAGKCTPKKLIKSALSSRRNISRSGEIVSWLTKFPEKKISLTGQCFVTLHDAHKKYLDRANTAPFLA